MQFIVNLLTVWDHNLFLMKLRYVPLLNIIKHFALIKDFDIFNLEIKKFLRLTLTSRSTKHLRQSLQFKI